LNEPGILFTINEFCDDDDDDDDSKFSVSVALLSSLVSGAIFFVFFADLDFLREFF